MCNSDDNKCSKKPNGTRMEGGLHHIPYGTSIIVLPITILHKAEMDRASTDAQNTADGEKLMNSPTLGLKEMAGTIMTELEKNENAKEVIVHVRVVRLPKGGKKGKKNAKAQVSTMSYKFDINQAIFHKMLAKRRQKQRKLLLARQSSSLTPTGNEDATGNMMSNIDTGGAAAEQGGPSQDPKITKALTAIAASNVSEPPAIPCAPFSFPAISSTPADQRRSFISSSRITRVVQSLLPSNQHKVSAIENIPLLPIPNLPIYSPTGEEVPFHTHTADSHQPEEAEDEDQA